MLLFETTWTCLSKGHLVDNKIIRQETDFLKQAINMHINVINIHTCLEQAYLCAENLQSFLK